MLNYSIENSRSGKLTAMWPVGRNSRMNVFWLCMCDCGNMVVARDYYVKSGLKSSCGCATGKHRAARRGRKTPEYLVWMAMKQRCHNQRSKDYHLYGARGISVCERWRESYSNFIEDMGVRPDSKLTLDRRDNDGNYESSNCRWATQSQQAFNRRPKSY